MNRVNANHEMEQSGEFTYTYDDAGNLTQKTGGAISETYRYDSANRLTQVEDVLTGDILANYGYDPFGRRLWKDVNGVRTYFFYADEGLIAEYDTTGRELRAYGYRPDSTWTTDPVFLKQDDEYYWYLNDQLGTPQTLVDSAGNVVWSAQYAAFGKATIGIEIITNNLRFPGQYYDVETGLHYNNQRYYDPERGRYTQTDPIGFDGGDVNLYAYVGNDPVNAIDTTGEEVEIMIKMRITRKRLKIAKSVVGKVWNSPNTAVGIVYGTFGLPFGADICLANNAIEFRNHPFMPTAITLGNVIVYSKAYGPKKYLLNGITVGEHERPHTYQGELLGPLYLPSNILGLGLAGLIQGDTHGSINWNERGPQSVPPRAW